MHFTNRFQPLGIVTTTNLCQFFSLSIDAAYLTTLLVPQAKRCQNTENSEVTGLRKERVVACIQILSRHFSEGTETCRIQCTIVGIRLSNIPARASSV